MDLFAPSHILILLVVILVLFGAKRLPGAAQSLGQSMHIFRRSVKGLDEDSPQAAGTQFTAAVPAAPVPPAQLAAQAAATPQQAQLDDIQRQLADLQRQSTGGNGAASGGAASAQPQRHEQS
ncbi:MAG TPA: twin-arginine translocase TatA/TatE family subunit [Streptosporangiaceae bacterium]|nr:twin-arginine translocase TatA/TatE family subunit [Streptosporangiaceae bacterium]